MLQFEVAFTRGLIGSPRIEVVCTFFDKLLYLVLKK